MWLTASLSVSISIVLMQLTKHYIPWRATALIAVTGSEEINMGYWYVITPVLSGVLILLIVALIFNNIRQVLSKSPKYHKFRKRIHNTLKTNDSILITLDIALF
jgi:CBS-domain-containing membrane protein